MWIQIDENIYAKEGEPTEVVNLVELNQEIALLQADRDEYAQPISAERIAELVAEEESAMLVRWNDADIEVKKREAIIAEINGN